MAVNEIAISPPSDDPNNAIDIEGIEPAVLIEWLRVMVEIRLFEEAMEPLVQSGKMPGGIHPAIGQEGVAVGVISALKPNDVVASPHRPHHHAIAKGLAARALMAELFGKATGCVGGRGGTMHVGDFSLGYYGGNGIVGAALGLATGAALSAQMQGADQVAVGFFGEGGANVGRVWESVNLASLWRLPLVAVCENNRYAISTRVDRATAGESIAQRAAGFGLTAFQVDGQDVCAMHRAVTIARARAVAGEGPTFIEALTYRYQGHTVLEDATMGDHRYRSKEEQQAWAEFGDPIGRLRRALEASELVSASHYDDVVREEQAIVDDAIEFAIESPWPSPESASANVTTDPSLTGKGSRWAPRP